jgi:hypothetical protein
MEDGESTSHLQIYSCDSSKENENGEHKSTTRVLPDLNRASKIYQTPSPKWKNDDGPDGPTSYHFRVSSPMISDEKTISFTDDGLYDVPHLEIKGAPLDTQPDVETDYSDVDFPTDCGNNTPRPSGLTHPNDSFSLQESKRRKVEQFSESEMDSFLDSVRPNVRSRSPLDRSFKMLGKQVYRYTALRNSDFRLLKILPERKTMIKCEIVHASFVEVPEYLAISYAWGDAGKTRRIELGGYYVHIGVNLHGALKALRQKKEPVLVWADALCIDQNNRDERTHQVQEMTRIYSSAKSVAIWLGPEADRSDLATDLLLVLSHQSEYPKGISHLIGSPVGQQKLAAIVSLFQREYWSRLWVVQEIFNARSVTVCCGSIKVPWMVYKRASDIFSQHRADINRCLPPSLKRSRGPSISANSQFSHSQVLVYQGPGSLSDLKSQIGLGEEAILKVLRAFRRKLTSDPKDKLYGILGVLPEATRKEFRVDYSLSVKEIYTEIVDYVVKTTECLDIICDAIHFPLHTGSATLPSFVPDWSHIPQTAALSHKFKFSAAGKTKAICDFVDEDLDKLEIFAIFLDTVSTTGISVGTLCTLADYLMAFIHWMALVLASLDKAPPEQSRLRIQLAFCETISLGQVPLVYSGLEWLDVCYHIFASLLRERLPHLPLNSTLNGYVNEKLDIAPEDRRQFLQTHFGDRMMGRCFCVTNDKHIGMGSGFMLPGDIIVVPLGCSTPILLRSEGPSGEYRFVGDVYIHGYMHGLAVQEWKDGKRKLEKYVLH